MEDHDLLIRIDEKLSQLKDGDTGDVPEIKRQIQGMDARYEAKFQAGDKRMDCQDRRITRTETYLKTIGAAVTIAAGSIIKLLLGR